MSSDSVSKFLFLESIVIFELECSSVATYFTLCRARELPRNIYSGRSVDTAAPLLTAAVSNSSARDAVT